MIEHAAAALFLDPGLGKTSITLFAIKTLKEAGLLNKVLIIAPLRVAYSVWPAEAKKWRDFAGLKIVVLHGPKKDGLLEEDADIYVTNPESLNWLLKPTKTKSPSGKVKMVVDAKKFKKLGFDTLVIDELTKFKNQASGRFKMFKSVVPTFARRWGLTGSPAANGLMHLFGQCYVLDEGRSLGQYITHYRAKYFDQSPYNKFEYTLKAGAEDEIYDRIRPLAMRINDDVLEHMPKLIENKIMVDMPPSAEKIYTALENDLIASLEDGSVSAATAAVASMKCRQVANGGVYIDPEVEALVKLPGKDRKVAKIHDAKTDALESLVEELQGSPLLVAYDFGHDLARIKERFGKDVPYIGGGVSPARSKELEDAWNAGELPILFGHPQSIGHGLNLQESGHHVALYSMMWDFELFDQFVRRVHRQGNKSKRVFVHFIMAAGTIDELMFYALKSKKRGQDALYAGLMDLRK